MDSLISELKPQPNDLLIVPLGTVIPKNAPFLVYQMKFLLTPSIIRSGAVNMSVLERLKTGVLSSWMGSSPFAFGYTKPGGSSLLISQQETRTEVSVVNTKSDETVREVKGTFIPELPRFYRYARMKGRTPETVNAKGGVSFFIELDAEHKTFAFSYALCHTGDNFNKKVARELSKSRFDEDDWYEVGDYDPSIGIIENIKDALFNELYADAMGKPATGAKFTSLSESTCIYELSQIFERI